MEARCSVGGSSWLSCGLFVLGLWCMNFSWVQPLECPTSLPSRLEEIFSSRQRGFTLTSKSTHFLHSYWLLYFEAAPFLGTSLIQLWAWVPIVPHASELVLEFKDDQKGPRRTFLGTFPIVFSSYESEGGWLLEIYCLLVYWMEVVPTFLAEEKTASTDASEATLRECASSRDKRDAVLLFISLSYLQPPLFHLPYVQEPFIPNMEQLILSQIHQEVDQGQAHPPTEKLCHSQDQEVNLHRASWGQCIVAPKMFSFPHCEGICLALNNELLHSNFECYKREVPTCSHLFQVCSPTKVRLFSLMVQDDEHMMSVHFVNTSLIEKCGCS